MTDYPRRSADDAPPPGPAVNSADFLGFPPGTVKRGEWEVEQDADGTYRLTLPLIFSQAGEFPDEEEGE
jgi:hypothetical protein